MKKQNGKTDADRKMNLKTMWDKIAAGYPKCKRHGHTYVIFSATGYYCTKCKKRVNK